jgi:hypothetical protein
MLITIVLGAISLAFVVIAAIEIMSMPPDGTRVINSILSAISRIFSVSLAGIGAVTLVFMAITRFGKPGTGLYKDDWTIAELEAISLDNTEETRGSIIFTMIFTALVCTLFLVLPSIVGSLEQLVRQTTLPLGHRIVPELLQIYAIILTIVWLTGLIPLGLRLVTGRQARWTPLANALQNIVSCGILLVMILDSRMYQVGGGHWAIGFGSIFAILFAVHLAELIGLAYTVIKKRLGRT